MGEGEPMSVQELPREPVLPLPAIGGIAGQGMSDGGEMSPDLMSAPGLQAGLEVGLGTQLLEHGEVGARFARSGPGDSHSVALPWGAPDRGVDRACARSQA